MKETAGSYIFNTIVAGLLLGGIGWVVPANAQEEPQYTVEEGKVDKATYNGYRRFHGTCHACHGQDALGSSFAPPLTERLKELTYAQFKETVTNGRTVQDASGGTNAMPAFADNPDIMKYLDDIYMFLKARSDGVLAPGRPEKIPAS